MRTIFLVTVISCACFLVANAVQAQESSSSSTDAVIFQMNDGRFYNPKSGLFAASREGLLSMIDDRLNATTTATETVTSSTMPSLLSAIRRGQDSLKEEQAHEREGILQSQLMPKSISDWRPITLALWDTKKDDIVLVRAKKKGAGLNIISGLPDGVSIKVTHSNYVNSEFAAKSIDNQFAVVAVRYPIIKERTIIKAARRKKIILDIQDVVYTPYSEALRSPEIVNTGKLYLQNTLNNVYDELHEERVLSRAIKGEFVADVVKQEVVKTIAAIEHASESEVKQDPDKIIDKFFIILAANESRAFSYEESAAGATGISQFMPKTYASVAARKDVKLEPIAEKGMRDVENALKAQIVYLDMVLSDILKKANNNTSSTDRLDEFVVAAYNAGGMRVRRAMEAWDDLWNGGVAQSIKKWESEKNRAQREVNKLKLAIKNEDRVKPLQKLVSNCRAEKKNVLNAENKIAALKKSSLKKETIGYIVKYRLLAPFLTETSAASSSLALN